MDFKEVEVKLVSFMDNDCSDEETGLEDESTDIDERV
jgi:hypothetical protein